jgi:hypothetical protein
MVTPSLRSAGGRSGSDAGVAAGGGGATEVRASGLSAALRAPPFLFFSRASSAPADRGRRHLPRRLPASFTHIPEPQSGTPSARPASRWGRAPPCSRALRRWTAGPAARGPRRPRPRPGSGPLPPQNRWSRSSRPSGRRRRRAGRVSGGRGRGSGARPAPPQRECLARQPTRTGLQRRRRGRPMPAPPGLQWHTGGESFFGGEGGRRMGEEGLAHGTLGGGNTSRIEI